MKILIFTRPWMTDFYKNIINNSILDNFEKHYITEFYKERKKIKNCSYIYLTKPVNKNYALNFFSDSELFDIIKRDRLLSKIEFNKALNYINVITEQLITIFSKVKPDIIFGHLVDTFIHDIFYRIAKKYDIFKFSMVWGGIVNNTFKFFDYRTPIIRKDVNDDVCLFKEMNNKREDISNPKLNRLSIVSRIKDKLSFIKTSFRVRNILDIEVRNKNIYYEYRKMRRMATPYLNLKDFLPGYYNQIIDIPNKKENNIYVSLHYVPEATMNNFSPNNTLVEHDKLILDIIKKYYNSYTFVIKEHPAMFNKRSLRFYEEIKQIPNTYLLHPSIKYYDILEKVNYVLSWGGTVGIEAPFFDVKTINIMKPYYYIDGYENYFHDYQDVIENFSYKIENINYDNHKYCDALNNYFKKILFTGINSEKYNTKDNIKNIANGVNYLITNNFKDV